MKRILAGLAYVLGIYLVIRAIAEPFVIDMGDPATYRDDWGGPSLVGVLAMHCLPGVISAVLIVAAIRRRRDAAAGRA